MSAKKLSDSELFDKPSLEAAILALEAEYGQEAATKAREIAQMSESKVKNQNKMTRRAALGLIGLGGAAVVGGSVVTGVAAKRAAKERIKDTAEQIIVWQKEVTKLTAKLFIDFWNLMLEMMKNMPELGSSFVHGTAEEIWDLLVNKDTKLDKLPRRLEDMLRKNPKLKGSYNKLKRDLDGLEEKLEELEDMIRDIPDLKYQREEFMREMREQFMEMLRLREKDERIYIK